MGGRVLEFEFWQRFLELENVVAIKVAPFDRYQTLDVVRALAESGRESEVALYTGNDDNIVADLLTDFRVRTRDWHRQYQVRGRPAGTLGRVDQACGRTVATRFERAGNTAS